MKCCNHTHDAFFPEASRTNTQYTFRQSLIKISISVSTGYKQEQGEQEQHLKCMKYVKHKHSHNFVSYLFINARQEENCVY